MKKINEMSIIELKGYAYDLIGIMERSQSDLQIINNEIAKRNEEPQKPEKVEKQEK
jgi:hypothetical protein